MKINGLCLFFTMQWSLDHNFRYCYVRIPDYVIYFAFPQKVSIYQSPIGNNTKDNTTFF